MNDLYIQPADAACPKCGSVDGWYPQIYAVDLKNWEISPDGGHCLSCDYRREHAEEADLGGGNDPAPSP